MRLSQKLVREVKSAFVKKGTSLNKKCIEKKINPGNIYPVLRGEINSEEAAIDRAIILTEAFTQREIKRLRLCKYVDLPEISTSSQEEDTALPAMDIQL